MTDKQMAMVVRMKLLGWTVTNEPMTPHEKQHSECFYWRIRSPSGALHGGYLSERQAWEAAYSKHLAATTAGRPIL